MQRTLSSRIAFFAAASFAIAGCVIVTSDKAGQPCESRDDCDDPDYDCVAGPLEQRTCQVRFPPVAVAEDAGTDGGGVVPAFWCNEVDALMQTHCASCHGVDRAGSGNQPLRLDVYEDDVDAGLAGAKTKANRIKIRMVDFKDMPPVTSPQPTDAERDTVYRWVLTGAQHCADGGM